MYTPKAWRNHGKVDKNIARIKRLGCLLVNHLLDISGKLHYKNLNNMIVK